MNLFVCILLAFLLVCAIAVSFTKNLLNSVLIYMSFSLIMSVIWILLESSDLAITEAAVGAGVTTVLFLITLKKLYTVRTETEKATAPAAETEKANEPAAEKEESHEEQEGR